MASIAGVRQRMRKLEREVQKRTTRPFFDNTLGLRINLSYARYAKACRTAPASRSELGERGYEVIGGVLSPEKSAALSARFSDELKRNDAAYAPPTWEGSFLVLKNPLNIFGPELFETIMPGPLDRALRAFFSGHYRVQCIDAIRTYPFAKPPHGSYSWHADNHPRECVKLMLYLTQTDAAGGGTSFIDKATTRAFVRRGYDGAVTKQRVNDLTPLAKKFGIDFRPDRPELEPGDGILFQGNNLHCGMLPTRGFRDVISIFFLPNHKPWQEALDDDGLKAAEQNAFMESSSRWMIWLDQARAD